ncbi:protein of unknown function [Candidatus Filomicrobium marinum]|uniref:Uncharacterized protein n=1 Tax=Candidatus Filomicrobium marinum TaxID=1608628 RepID=A0A0D6JGP3_9HYPH|nr:protein of unknown function [Candidatus Filomicrobium marinum]CPR19639.1 protein of unknown function [Candidatus Filomicrobium marinum]
MCLAFQFGDLVGVALAAMRANWPIRPALRFQMRAGCGVVMKNWICEINRHGQSPLLISH